MALVPQEVFVSAVPYYARCRTSYPRERVAELAAKVGLDGGHWVVDIGCGSGQMTIPLARHAGSVVAIDPIQAMLDHGRATAEATGLGKITWLQGDAQHLSALIQPGALVAVLPLRSTGRTEAG